MFDTSGDQPPAPFMRREIGEIGKEEFVKKKKKSVRELETSVRLYSSMELKVKFPKDETSHNGRKTQRNKNVM